MVQGIRDSSRRFLDVCTGVSGNVHDSRMLRLSLIWGKLPQLCGEKYHHLGNSAYTVRERLLTPFRDHGMLTEQQLHFNLKLSETRVVTENGFSILKQRFCQLKGLEFRHVDTFALFILACCVLHNLCLTSDDDSIYDADDGNSSSTSDDDDDTNNACKILSSRRHDLPDHKSENLLRKLGDNKRGRLCKLMC